MTTVSVVITNFNYARYLDVSAGSALRQAADEVIVVDNGSTRDGSREVIAAMGTAVIPLFLPTNGGHVGAVNAGYEIAHGDVIIFLDADDVLLDGCIDAVKAAWTPGVSKIQWGQFGIDDHGVRTGTLYPKFTSRHTPEWCRREMQRQSWYDAPPTSGNAWSRSMLSRLMPLPRLGSQMWALDDYLHLLAPYFGDVISLAEPLGEYRVHPGQVSGHATFSVQRHGWVTSDEILRYDAVNAVLVSMGHPPLDCLAWSQHTLNRIFLRRLGRSTESILPLLPRHITACLRSDTGVKSKIKNIGLGLALTIARGGATERLARLKYQR